MRGRGKEGGRSRGGGCKFDDRKTKKKKVSGQIEGRKEGGKEGRNHSDLLCVGMCYFWFVCVCFCSAFLCPSLSIVVI